MLRHLHRECKKMETILLRSKMITNIDYRSWLEEDLVKLLTDLKFQRDRVETYSERVDINQEIGAVKTELNTRKDNE
jgi:hypothetical protein